MITRKEALITARDRLGDGPLLYAEWEHAYTFIRKMLTVSVPAPWSS